MSLSHVDDKGRARMVDVGGKPVTQRTAVAEGQVRMSAEAFALVRENAIAKGDVLRVAEVAGTMGPDARVRLRRRGGGGSGGRGGILGGTGGCAHEGKGESDCGGEHRRFQASKRFRKGPLPERSAQDRQTSIIEVRSE